ncbi:recombination protein RecO [Campylobacter lari]|uniref:recombination protein RecO n=1 Tax=Campylobacter TaxID=194 RepID=UPI0006402800|nr:MULTISPECIES: recombination protein RecO [Campylobacter]AKJ53022.1 recombination protein RecO [Campylobacter lari]EAK0823027.1 recombination protein RecO [Campylobacter lari]MCV3406213.1 recombination protein RecO [Campylobacter lari]MCV3462609.1 recombination protein RecO [Campylobacter sp. FU_497]HEC1759287.1 recombination protein RecO [Campylobacter lari]
MQGFILHTQSVKDEDLIVYLLSAKRIIKSYRFYGMRHSNILSGYKIDFELEESSRFLPRLKDVLHIGFSWILDRERMFFWQEFIRLFYWHLKDVEEIDSFYFELLEDCAKRFEKQDCKRVIVDAYLKILSFEGRLHKSFVCFYCDEYIQKNVVLVRAFLPAHKKCAFGYEFKAEDLAKFYENFNSSHFSDEYIDNLYKIIKEGF